jgi:hypothetical protein
VINKNGNPPLWEMEANFKNFKIMKRFLFTMVLSAVCMFSFGQRKFKLPAARIPKKVMLCKASSVVIQQQYQQRRRLKNLADRTRPVALCHIRYLLQRDITKLLGNSWPAAAKFYPDSLVEETTAVKDTLTTGQSNKKPKMHPAER